MVVGGGCSAARRRGRGPDPDFLAARIAIGVAVARLDSVLITMVHM